MWWMSHCIMTLLLHCVCQKHVEYVGSFVAHPPGALHFQMRNEPCHERIKCTLAQALTICTGRTAHRGSRGTALPFYDHGTRRGWGVSVTPRPLFIPGKDPVSIVQEAGWAPGPVWIGVENLAPHRDSISDRPARSQLLYRLRYLAHWRTSGFTLNVKGWFAIVSITCLPALFCTLPFRSMSHRSQVVGGVVGFDFRQDQEFLIENAASSLPQC
jgi:hypothetical protein